MGIWVQKPQLGIQINWGNPLTRGIAGCWLLNEGGGKIVNELVKIKPVTTNNTATVYSQKGLAKQCSINQVNIEYNSEFIKTSDGAGTGDFTMLVMANPSSGGGAVEHLLVQKNDAGGAPYGQAAVLSNSDKDGVYSAGSIAMFTYSGSQSGAASASQCDGNFHVWVGLRLLGYRYIYKDGVLLATSAGNTAHDITNNPTTRYTAIGSRGNGTTESANCKIALAMCWDRALLPSEIWSLYVSPYQFLSRGYMGLDEPATTATSSILKVNSVARASISKYNGVDLVNIGKIEGVS